LIVVLLLVMLLAVSRCALRCGVWMDALWCLVASRLVTIDVVIFYTDVVVILELWLDAAVYYDARLDLTFLGDARH